jgi:hypothetical protein
MAISFADCRVERYEENLNWSGQFFEAFEGEIEAFAVRSLYRQSLAANV